MLTFLKIFWKRNSFSSGPETLEDRKLRAERLKAILKFELALTQVDGRPVTHRRLESLMLATGAGKKETVRLLREIGARPSGRHGDRIWTLRT